MFQNVSRRSPPQRKIDDAAFPVRVYLRVPSDGIGRRLDALHSWLAKNIDRGDYAIHAGGWHPGSNGLEDRLAIYVRHPEIASTLLTEFSELELSDGTEAITYTSPAIPFGRRRSIS